jgi:nucleotidyltransferase/DNA polymerase involved in DNA repair
VLICVTLPFFAAGIEQRLNPAYADELLVLVDSTRKVRRIAAVSRQIAALDIPTGMVLSHAQTLIRELPVLPLNPPHYRASLEGLIDTLRTFSDRIQVLYKGWGAGDEKVMLSEQAAASALNPAVVFLDIGRLNPKSLYALGQQLQAALKLRGYSAQIGIASNRFTAWVAAQTTREGTLALVNQGEEKWMLTCHPISLLPLDEKTLSKLWWLGIRTLGDFTELLPSASIRPRYGKAGQKAYQLAQGIDSTTLPPLARQRELSRSFAFEEGISDRQVVSEMLNKLTRELVASLGTSGETARKLRLTLGIEDRGAGEFEKLLRRRSYTHAQFFNALQTLLDHAKVSAPITEIAVTLEDIVPLVAQQIEMFPAMRSMESPQAVLEDLVACHGERFYTSVMLDGQSQIPDKQFEFKVVDIA